MTANVSTCDVRLRCYSVNSCDTEDRIHLLSQHPEAHSESGTLGTQFIDYYALTVS